MLLTFSVALALLVSLAAPLRIKPMLQRLEVIDVPNERSSHSRPVIRGVGLAPLLAVAAAFAVLLLGGPHNGALGPLTVIVMVALAAGLLGWLEDWLGLRVAVRAGGQLVIGLAGAGALVSLAGSAWWLVPILGVCIAGYINVANFMDGINGISGFHGVVAGAAFAIIGGLGNVSWMVPAGLIIGAAFLGFLPWNLMQDGMFLGDVGSYLLGGSLAAVAVAALVSGVPILAVVGPLAIYLADSSVTLVRRIVRGEPWYVAHRTHVYQRLTDLQLSHIQVSFVVTIATMMTAASGLLVLESLELWPISVAFLLATVALYLSSGRIFSLLKSRVNRDHEGVAG